MLAGRTQMEALLAKLREDDLAYEYDTDMGGHLRDCFLLPVTPSLS